MNILNIALYPLFALQTKYYEENFIQRVYNNPAKSNLISNLILFRLTNHSLSLDYSLYQYFSYLPFLYFALYLSSSKARTLDFILENSKNWWVSPPYPQKNVIEKSLSLYPYDFLTL